MRSSGKQLWSWAFYDWANSAFATSILAAFFPIFLNRYWVADAGNSTVILGFGNAAAAALIVVLAPLLGAMADAGHSRLGWLIRLAVVGMVTTAALAWVPQGNWQWAIALFVIANFGFMGANTLYDSLISVVAQPGERESASALGYAMGYLGGALLFAVHMAMVSRPDWFGLPDATTAVRVAMVSVAVWWFLFSLPLFRSGMEPTRVQLRWREGIARLRATVTDLASYRKVWWFLIAYWLYIDGVHTVVRMAVDFGARLGFDNTTLLTTLLLSNLVGFPATLLYGKLGQRVGPRLAILIGLCAYCLIALSAFTIQTAGQFMAIGVAVGLVQGGVQSMSRALFTDLAPEDKCGEFFGFYNMLGKFAAVLGPLLVAAVSLMTSDPRMALGSVLVLFIAGGTLLWRSPQ